MEAWGLTDPGKVRNQNQDYYELKQMDDKSILAVVCDGMGGEEYGEKASLFAVENLKEFQNKDFNKYVNEYIEKANKRICDLIEENKKVVSIFKKQQQKKKKGSKNGWRI